MIKRLFIVILVLNSIIITAQRNSSSPYSFFGIGQEFSPKTVENASMGGIGVAITQLNHLNFSNPAAYADLRYTTYSLGGETSFLSLKETNASQSGNSTSLRYVALGFPIGKKAGFSAGLQPLSSVGYALLNQKTDADGNITQITRFTGDGGTNRLYGSFGIKVLKGLNLGLEAGFIFGTITNNVATQRAGVSLATKNEEKINIRGGQFKVGAQYKTEFKDKLQLNTGISIQLENSLGTSGTERLYSLSYGNNGVEIPRDILVNKSFKGNFKQPAKTILGAGLGKENKWYAGINYEFQGAFNNQDYITASAENSYKYEDSNRISLGGFYTPKINSISSYWNRVTYRAGLRVEKTGLLVDGTGTGNNFTSINDFGINVGLGLPLPKQISTLNLGFEYGQKGTTNNNLIKENYFNVRLSLSLNSLFWFKKREID